MTNISFYKTTILGICAFFLGLNSTAAQWRTTPETPVFNIQPLDSLRLWAFTQEEGGAALMACAYSADGGDTWEEKTAFPNSDGFLLAWGLSAIDEQHVWAHYYKYNTGVDYLLKSNDGGQTWLSASYPSGTNRITQMRFWTPEIGVVVADNANTNEPFKVYRTTNAGNSWVQLSFNTFPGLVGYDYVSAVYNKGNAFWIHTFKGRLYKTTNMGQTWASAGVVPEQAIYGSSIAFENEMTGMLRITSTDAKAVLRKTVDGGETWNLLYTDGLPLERMQTLRNVVPVPENPGYWVAGTSEGAAYTRDGGTTWTRMNTWTYADFWQVVFTSSTRGFVTTSGSNYGQWKGALGDPHCIQFLEPLHSKMERKCDLKVELSARVDISGDTAVNIGWRFNPPAAAGTVFTRKFIPNLKEYPLFDVSFTPEPGTPHVGLLKVKTNFATYSNLDSTQAINTYQLFPTSCEQDTTTAIHVRPGIFYQRFHPNCFQVVTDTVNCYVKLLTNVCGYDTNQYTIRYWFPDNTEPFPWVATSDQFVAPQTPINQVLTFYIIRDTFAFNHGLNNCFETIEAPLVCGVSGVDTAPESQWSISPNPASAFLTIRGHTDRASRVTVANFQQEIVFSSEIYGTTVVDTHLWNSGIYLVRIDSANRPPVLRKVVLMQAE